MQFFLENVYKTFNGVQELLFEGILAKKTQKKEGVFIGFRVKLLAGIKNII